MAASGGWARAFHYVKAPGAPLARFSPERIARGIWAGVFTTFTPFYGLHFHCGGLGGRRIMQRQHSGGVDGHVFRQPAHLCSRSALRR